MEPVFITQPGLRSGAIAPAADVGTNGDFYIQIVALTDQRLYGPKNAGAWPSTYAQMAAAVAQTPWTQNIDGAGYSLANLGVLTFAAGGGITQDNWTAATLQNSWVNYGTPYSDAGYRKDKQGNLLLRGMLKSGTIANGTIIFTLDAAHRPAKDAIVGANAQSSFCRLLISASGSVAIYEVPGNSNLSLDGVSIPLS